MYFLNAGIVLQWIKAIHRVETTVEGTVGLLRRIFCLPTLLKVMKSR
jgi:hypothetical protein